MRVVVAGGTGLIGRALVPSLTAAGHEVTVLSRSGASVQGARGATWDGRHADEDVLDGADAVVNLAGTSLGGAPWTQGRKRRILDSRVASTDALVDAISRLDPARRPRVYVSASGIGYVGDRGDDVVDEDAPPGDTFLASVCVAWEQAALRAEALGLRVVLLRTALVFAADAPAFRLLTLPFRLLVGGRIGSGRQWFPWIHLDDAVRLYRCALEDDGLQGPVHAVAPEIVRQAELARALGRVLHRPSLLPAPAWAVRLALGDQSQLVLDSQHAISRKLAPDAFLHPQLDGALRAALS